MRDFLYLQNLVLQAPHGQALGNAVAVAVHQHILDAQIAVLLRCVDVVGVGLPCFILDFALHQVAVRRGQVRFVSIQAHQSQVGHGDFHHPADIGAFLQERRSPLGINQQVVGVECLDLDDVAPLDALETARVQLDRLAHFIHHHIGADVLNLCAFFLHQQGQHLIGRALEWQAHNVLFLLLAPHDSAVLHGQGVFERGVEDQKAVVLLIKDVVAGIGCLFGALYIRGARRLKADGLVGAGEDFEQGGENPLHRVIHVAGDDLRPVFLLVAVGLTVILT